MDLHFMHGLRGIAFVILLALGVVSIGATSVFGMTSASAMASMHAEDANVGTSCLLHCFVAQDISVGSGVLAIDVFAAGMALLVAVTVFAVVPHMVSTARRVPLCLTGPRFLLTVCKRE